jgi:transcriptional regulator with XRE-family HTH domain
MKTKIGTKLKQIREDRRLTQEGIAAILGMDDAAYGRLERNETQADFNTIIRFAEKLNVPIHDFLPELTTMSNNNNHGTGAGAGIVFGNINYYASPDDTHHSLLTENAVLKEKIAGLEEQNRLLRQLLEQKNG